MLRRSVLLLGGMMTAFAVAADLPLVSPDDVGMSMTRLERIDSAVARYVDTGVFPGAMTLVARHGKVVHRSVTGQRGFEDERPIPADALFRMYSSSKVVTAVAMMQLYEQGLFHLSDPVAKFIPELGRLEVQTDDGLVPASRQPTMRQLLSHTSGFSYGIDPSNVVDRAYLEAELWHATDLDDFVARVAALPLMFEPGERWNYSVGMDLAGVIVERLSGKRFDRYLEEHLFEPLDMRDTGFRVAASEQHRLLPLNVITAGGSRTLEPDSREARQFPGGIFTFGCRALCDFDDVSLFSGGAGLVSSARDFLRFGDMLRGGGELDGVRILGPLTIDLMASPHIEPQMLPGGASFGLGVAVLRDPVAAGELGSPGEFFHDGAAGTIFWVDRAEGIVALGLVQLMGMQVWRRDLKTAVYQAVTKSERR